MFWCTLRPYQPSLRTFGSYYLPQLFMASRPPASNNCRVTRSATRAACVETTSYETTSDSYHQQCRRNRAHRSQALRIQRAISRRNSSSTSDSNSTRDLATRRRAARAAVLAHRRRTRNDSSRYASPSIVHQHFTRIRSPRHPTPSLRILSSKAFVSSTHP